MVFEVSCSLKQTGTIEKTTIREVYSTNAQRLAVSQLFYILSVDCILPFKVSLTLCPQNGLERDVQRWYKSATPGRLPGVSLRAQYPGSRRPTPPLRT